VTNERRLIVHESTKSHIAEAYRTLRTNIRFSKTGVALKTILFTSAGPGEAKSTTSANAAVAFAQAGKKVIIVDCDLRKPIQHKIFRCPDRGLTNALVEDIPVAELLQDTLVPNLYLLSSGPIPPNPSELLSSPKMHDILAELAADADYVFLDTPPVIAVTDACVIASLVDGVIIVLDAGAVRPEMAQRAKALIQNAHGHLLGVILARVQFEKEHSYYYYYSDRKKTAGH